jgi:hypothetical protein
MHILDTTRSVSVSEPLETAAAIDDILAGCFGADAFDRELVRASFALAGDLFAGEHPGYLACDMPYHDLRHSLDTALTMARLIDGYQRQPNAAREALSPEYGVLGVVLALLHDSGFIRTTSEHALCGPQLMADHESRGVDLARTYLAATSLREHADLAPLVLATQHSARFGQLFDGRDATIVALGRMLGSADLLSQIADHSYLERCYYHLYPEFVLSGYDRVRAAGQERVIYRDAFDLLCKTPSFYRDVVTKRLGEDFGGIAACMSIHFVGSDPYADAIRANLERCAIIAADGDTRQLGPEPTTTTRHPAAISGTS